MFREITSTINRRVTFSSFNSQLGRGFRGASYGKLLSGICVAAAILTLGADRAFAVTIGLTSGVGGSLMSGQSYNETRTTDVTVLSGTDLLVESMTLDGFDMGGATSALLGGRIYDDATSQLIASGNVTIYSDELVTVPISATLASGGDYRVGFYAATNPPNYGNANVFLPSVFPYTELTGLLQINEAYDIPADSFPTIWNEALPLVSLQVVAVPEPATGAPAADHRRRDFDAAMATAIDPVKVRVF